MDKEGDAIEDDASLFRRAVGDIRRHDDDTVILRGKRPGPDPRYTRLDHETVLNEMLFGEPPGGDCGSGDEVFFQRPGVRRSVMRKLRRAQFAVQDELDLHGMTAAEAKTALGAFIQGCAKRGVYCIRVVHGKGHRSPGREPVLKPKVVRWLSQLGNVVAFSSARPVDGGTGALYVLLKRSGR